MATKRTRNENPGVRTQNPAAPSLPNKDIDEPWIGNYPPLNTWLMDSDARCDWQLRYGKGRDGFMLEQWRMPGSLPFIVLVYTRQMGWEIFTPGSEISIDKTLEDCKARIYPMANKVTP